MPNKFDELAGAAVEMTDEQFKSEMSSLTRLTDSEIRKIIEDTGISKQDLAAVLREVKDASSSNEAKANSIRSINNGVSALVAVAKKLL